MVMHNLKSRYNIKTKQTIAQPSIQPNTHGSCSARKVIKNACVWILSSSILIHHQPSSSSSSSSSSLLLYRCGREIWAQYILILTTNNPTGSEATHIQHTYGYARIKYRRNCICFSTWGQTECEMLCTPQCRSMYGALRNLRTMMILSRATTSIDRVYECAPSIFVLPYHGVSAIESNIFHIWPGMCAIARRWRLFHRGRVCDYEWARRSWNPNSIRMVLGNRLKRYMTIVFRCLWIVYSMLVCLWLADAASGSFTWICVHPRRPVG